MATLAFNRKASFEYNILETFEAGIVLQGFEVKAIREGKVDFEGSFIKFIDEKPVLLNMHVGAYSKQGTFNENGDTRRSRGLLLKKYEITRLVGKASQKGYTLVPLKLKTDHGLIKLELGLAQGKKKFDKKDSLKVKQQERDLKRETKDLLKN